MYRLSTVACGMLRVLCFILFTLGAVAIGLVLLDHEHCALSDPNIMRTIITSADGSITSSPVASEGGDAHAGHNH